MQLMFLTHVWPWNSINMFVKPGKLVSYLMNASKRQRDRETKNVTRHDVVDVINKLQSYKVST